MNGVTKLYNAFCNLKNWQDYKLKKKEIFKSSVSFITKPNPVSIIANTLNYSVFKEIFVEDFYTIKDIIKLIDKPNPVVVDIGANVGFFSVLISSKYQDPSIYLFEPFDKNVVEIENIISENPGLKNQFNINKSAVSDGIVDRVEFYVKEDTAQTSVASIYKDFDNENLITINVPCTSLNKIFKDNKLSSIDILKMDCEGAEYSIIYACTKENLSNIKLVLIEVHKMDNELKNAEALKQYFIENNFDVKISLFNNGCHFMMAINKTK